MGGDSPISVAQWTEGETTRLLSSAEVPGLYLLRPRFLSKSETMVFLLLRAAFPRHEIFARIRLADVLQVIEAIVDRLEKGDVELEASILIYERGEALKAHCDALLRKAEAKVEKISLNANNQPTGTEPLDVED